MKKMGCAQCGGAKMKKGGAKKVGCPPNCSDVDKKDILRTTSSKIAAGVIGAAAGIGSAVGATKAAKKMKAIKEIKDKAKQEGKSLTRKQAKAVYNKPKALPEEKKGGAIKKMQTGGVPKRNISKPGAGFAPETKGGSNVGMNIYGIPNAGQTGPNRRVTTETMQKGGGFAPNRAVQSSCKNGMVRDENGRCVMVRKAQTGGSSKFGMLSVKAGVDNNPSATAADRIAGAKMNKKQNGGEAAPSKGLTKKQKSSVAKKASSGKDIGKKGKMFAKIAAKAGGGDKGKRIAAAAMWKNIKRG